MPANATKITHSVQIRQLLTAALAAASLMALAGIACAQEKANALPDQTLLAFERAPLSRFLVDDKDAAFRQAFGLLPGRLASLPAETMGKVTEEAVDILSLALKTVANSSRFAITYSPTTNVGGAMGYGVIAISTMESADEARQLGEVVEHAIEESGSELPAKSERFKGLRSTTIPGGSISFGVRDGSKDHTYDVLFGTVPDSPETVFSAIPSQAIDGLTPVVRGSFDFQALTPLASVAQMGISQVANQRGIKPPNVFLMLSNAGLIGPNAIHGSFIVGHTADASRFQVRVDNAQATLKAISHDAGRLTANDINLIPSDAVSANMSLVSFDLLSKLVSEVRKQVPEVREALTKFTQVTSVDFEKDLLPTLGGIGGYYTSESTGGGGFLSGVAFLSFKDRAAFLTTHDKLISAARNIIMQQAHEAAQYVKVRSWEIGGTPAFSIIFPGLPVPLEFSYAATDKYLIAGLTPQAVTFAVNQFKGKGDKGLLSRDDLRLIDASKQELISIGFTDTPKYLRAGYGSLALVGSAVSNAVRTPGAKAGSPEPGITVPSYNDLAKGVKPSISLSYRSGDALIIDSASDRSLLVNLGASLGFLADFSSLSSLASAAGTRKAVEDSDLMTWLPALPGIDDRQRTIAATVMNQFLDLLEGPHSLLSSRRWAAAGVPLLPLLGSESFRQ